MLFFAKPRPECIRDFVAARRASPFSYTPTGVTALGRPGNFTVDRNNVRLGTGLAVFEKAAAAVRAWKMFAMPWLSLHPAAPSVETGTAVAVLVSHFGFWSLNPCRIVYTIDEPTRFGFAYGTVIGHSEIGEELFCVDLDPDTGNVWYRILAYSRPTPLVRMASPLARLLQKRFARQSLAAMVAAVRG